MCHFRKLANVASQASFDCLVKACFVKLLQVPGGYWRVFVINGANRHQLHYLGLQALNIDLLALPQKSQLSRSECLNSLYPAFAERSCFANVIPYAAICAAAAFLLVQSIRVSGAS